jgi:hypothetical protein
MDFKSDFIGILLFVAIPMCVLLFYVYKCRNQYK